MRSQPNNVDVQVGNAIRIQRVIKRLSQSALGERVGISFQQIQKYERGANRVSASMLVDMANALEVDVRVFFDEAAPPKSAILANDNQVVSETFKASREGMLLNAAFFSIKNKAIREKILRLVLSLAGKTVEDGDKEEIEGFAPN
ncbi:helix-turn-helix domain-containing protein [Aliirhizobium smilacinae]|uniref:Helix-turn-helix transcriptional regulator n=1 Tax=Aliirhizobium smilacinae TaxID=1395944 RepID=A0A5C4XBW7_9HYPH|nr:helix-turn-helix transcriptional regulator [Rhizobium smilacinae]TNM59904.1 helix-turn-helix transcriptional regulator [Rhizobium smilacinae]